MINVGSIHNKKYLLKFIYKNLGIFFVIFLTMIMSGIYTIPYISFKVGNVFFGDIKLLYNINIAQMLYKRSVNPVFSQPVPQYAHHQLSRTYFIQGKLYTALKEAKKELELYPNSIATYYILGLTYGYINKEYDAINAFSIYIEANQKAWAPRNDKAWLQFRIGDIDGAIKTLGPVVETHPYNVWVQNTYCVLMINKRELILAKNACQKAKHVAEAMTEKSWGIAYPGNDPRIYGTGLQAMRLSIDNNLAIIEEKLSMQNKTMTR